MLKKLIPVIIAILILNGCQTEDAESAFDQRILGNWKVVSENYDQSVVEWGLFYVGSVKLYEDKSFKVNVGDQPDDPNVPKHGTWKLTTDKSSIVFYSFFNDVGTIYQDTTSFKISFDQNEKMILENEWIKILHERINN